MIHLDIVTRLRLKADNSRYLRTEKFKFYDGNVREIIIFENEDPLLYAQAVPFSNSIRVKDSIFAKTPKNLRTFVLEHEYAHHKVGWFINPVLLSTIVLSLWFIYKSDILLSILLAILFLVLQWSNEIYANTQAIKVLGIANAKEVCKKFFKRDGKLTIKQLILMLIQPPMSLSLWVYGKFLT